MNQVKSTPADGAKRINFLLGRLTVLRSLLRCPPVAKLSELCDAIATGDAMDAAFKYHSMTAEMLDQSNRRVTGDLWRDCVFAELLETPNRFSVLASEGHMDPPVKQAMVQDLRILQELFDLSCELFIDWIVSIAPRTQQNANRQQVTKERDGSIERMALSAWNGGSLIREKQRARSIVEPMPTEGLPSNLETEKWARWGYEDPGERVVYIADEGLAVIYRRFIAEPDWGTLIDSLMEFHRQYGCGEFLRYRIFTATDDGMLGLDDSEAPEWDELICTGKQKEALYANTLRFLHTGRGENALLYGAEGMGKTALVLALTKELPELRLIFLAQRDFASSLETIRSLEGQPFRFIAFMDDLSLSEREYRRLKATFATKRGTSNCLVYATSPICAPDGSFFTLEVPFSTPTYDSFKSIVAGFLPGIGEYEIDMACEQWQKEKEDYSIRAAKRLSERIARARKH